MWLKSKLARLDKEDNVGGGTAKCQAEFRHWGSQEGKLKALPSEGTSGSRMSAIEKTTQMFEAGRVMHKSER